MLSALFGCVRLVQEDVGFGFVCFTLRMGCLRLQEKSISLSEGCFLDDVFNINTKSVFIKDVNFWTNLIRNTKSIFNKDINSKICYFLDDVLNKELNLS